MNPRLSLATILLGAILLSGCLDTDGPDAVAVVTPDVTLQGSAVKGLLINSQVSVYILDFTEIDLKGGLIATGTTNATGSLADVVIPGARIAEGPFLLEYTGGTELNGTAPVISTLRTVVTIEQAQTNVVTYATPFTSFAIELARLNSTDTGSFLAALAAAQQTVKDFFGLGVLDAVDLFTTAPILISTSGQDQSLAYRTAIEVFGALLSELNAFDINTPVDDIFLGLAQDLSDNILDAALDGSGIDALGGIGSAQLLTTLTKAPVRLNSLVVPGTEGTTMTPVDGINQLMADEAAIIAPGLPLQPLVAPTIHQVVPGTDSDGDLFADNDDDFPQDPTQAGDSDGDSFDDVIDIFPDDMLEWEDSDGDGVGNNGDVFPDDPNRQTLEDNTPPVAIAGVDRTAEITLPAILDGNASSDPDNDQISFSWRFIPPFPIGSTATLINADTATPEFVPDVVDTFILELTVDDGFGGTATDTITVTAVNDVVNTAPIADAGPDQSVDHDTGEIMIDLTAIDSGDPQGDPITYAWTILSTPDSTPPAQVALTGANTATPVLTITPLIPLGDYTIGLTVNDGEFDSTDQVVVSVRKLMAGTNMLLSSALIVFGTISLVSSRRRRQS